MNTIPPKNRRVKTDPAILKKRRIKRKIKLAAFFLCVILALTAVVWGVIALIGSIGDSSEDASSYVSDISQYIEASSQADSSPNVSTAEPSDDFSEPEETSVPEEKDKWNLILINSKNPVPEDYELNLAAMEGETIRGGGEVLVDARIIEPLEEMLADARADGIIPKITSAYRSIADQQATMEEYINDYIAEGMTREEAEAEAKRWVAMPGASEHQIGIAVDISTADWSQQGADVVWAWLEENCWKYGFILRYTEEWASITGAAAEPWHFRYVGTEYAKAITESGLPYEQYLEQYIY